LVALSHVHGPFAGVVAEESVQASRILQGVPTHTQPQHERRTVEKPKFGALIQYIHRHTLKLREPAYRVQYESFVANDYGVASVSRIDKMIGLFCKRAL